MRWIERGRLLSLTDRGRRSLPLVAALAAVAVGWAALEAGIVALPTAVGPRTFAGLLALAFAALACWGLVLAVVLSALGAGVGSARAVGLSLATKFVGAVAPFGQATGGPVSGLLIASGADVKYERALAAVVAVNAVTCATGLAVGAVGLGLEVGLGAGNRVPGSDPTAVAAVGVGVLAVAALPAACWRRRDRIAALVAAAVVPPWRLLAGLRPRFDAPTRAAVAGRIGGLFAAVERTAADPRRLAVAVGFAALGQGLTAACLWFALRAVGAPVSFSLLLGVLTLASVGSLVPLPGGAAGVEAALIGLLVSLAGVAVPPASAAVLLFRTATFWAPLPVCALLAVRLGDREVFRSALP